MMEVIWNAIAPKLFEIAALIIALVLSFVCLKIKQFVSRFSDNDTAVSLSRVVVVAIEQMYQTLHGQDKMDKALEMLSGLLENRNIHLSVDEMKALLESAVGEANGVFTQKSVDAEASAE